MPIRPPHYDPAQYGTGFGAAGGAPPDVVAPRRDTRGHGGAPSTMRPRSAIVFAVLGAVIASAITSGLFLRFGRTLGETGQSVATAPNSDKSSPGTLVGGHPDIHALLEHAQPSVVSIRTSDNTARGVYDAAGSGLIVDKEGLVLTNAHVIAKAASIKITLFDGAVRYADLVGSNPEDDVALVRMKDPPALTPAELGSSADAEVGDSVVAIGNALNLGGLPSVTEGIVSAKGRNIDTNTNTLRNLIQTDAAINEGNSGGPLLNVHGQVIGLNTAIITDAQNIGFAIAIDEVKPLIDELKRGNGTITPDTAFLGIGSTGLADVNATTRTTYGVTATEGAFITEVVEGSAAGEGGLQAGDVIMTIDGQAIADATDVGTAISEKKPGEPVVVVYQRRGQRREATVTLKSRRETGS